MAAAKGALPLEAPLGVAKDMIPITASSANNVFGNPVNVAAGTGDMRCGIVWCDGATTFSGVVAAGNTRSNIISGGGVVPCQFIQITSITGGTMRVFT